MPIAVLAFVVLHARPLDVRRPPRRWSAFAASCWCSCTSTTSVDSRDHDFSDVAFVLIAGRRRRTSSVGVVRRLDCAEAALEEREELVRARGDPRRARPDRPRAARRDRPLGQRDGGADRGRRRTSCAPTRTRAERSSRDVADDRPPGAGRDRTAAARASATTADELGLAPAPGSRDLPGWSTGSGPTASTSTCEVDDRCPALPAGVDVSAYRIVQEALTNALRYAADRPARCTVRGYAAGRRRSRPPTGATAPARSGSGLGLLGMAERVALLGGTLTHGRHGDGGFELDATLPVRR